MTEDNVNGSTRTETNHPKPSLAVDICLFRDGGSCPQLLLIKRGGEPYKGRRALPGGFVEEGESARDAVMRELEEETSVVDARFEPVGLYSAPERDPRGWVVSEAYAALADECALAKAGDDAEDAVWFDISTTGVPPVQGEKRPLRKIVLSTDEEEYELVYAIEEGPLSRIPRSRVVDSAGLAFDHAQIICDTWLRVVKEIGKNGIEG